MGILLFAVEDLNAAVHVLGRDVRFGVQQKVDQRALPDLSKIPGNDPVIVGRAAPEIL